MSAARIRLFFPDTCGEGLARRLAGCATARTTTLRFLRYPS
jgi:hypothetical protein